MRFGALRYRAANRLLLAAAPLGLLAGCAALAVTDAPPERPSATIEWAERYVREHLRFFNGSEIEGRGTATAGYARAATYVSARMRQFGLQPALHREFRVVFQTPMNYPLFGALGFAHADTLQFFPGVDYLIDARSDSGVVVADRVQLHRRAVDETSAGSRAEAPVVAIHGEQVSLLELQQLAARGFAGALLIGTLRPDAAPQPVDGLVILQITPAAASVLLEDAVPGFDAANPVGGVFTLPSDMRIEVRTDFRRDAGAVNVLGYLPGRDPVRRHELVVVCADLDAVGNVGGVSTLDFENFGVSTAALLEIARNYGNMKRFAASPERTVLFAVFSGSRLGNAGLRAYLQNPLWPVGQTAAVVYVGLPASREAEVRNLLEPFGIPLFVVEPAPEPLHEVARIVIPEPGYIRRAGDRAAASAVPAANLSQVLTNAISRAQMRAEETHQILLPLTQGFGADTYAPLAPSHIAK